MKTTKVKKHVIRKKSASAGMRDDLDETLVQSELKDAPLRREKKRKLRQLASHKTLYYLIAVVVLFFIGLLVALFFMKQPVPLSIDDYHEMNLNGELDPEDGYLYNGFSFVKVRGSWFTRLQRKDTNESYHLEVRYGPRDVEEIPLSGDYAYLLTFNSTFITFDPAGKDFPHVALAAADLSTNLVRVFATTPVAACTQPDEKACANRQIITCTQGIPAIFIKEDPVPAVIAEGTCITVQGEDFDLVKAANRLLLAWYGIM